MLENFNEKAERKVMQKNFGAHLKKIRKEKGISGAELARRCLMEHSHITRLETGNINPSLFVIKKIANCMGMSLYELFHDFE